MKALALVVLMLAAAQSGNAQALATPAPDDPSILPTMRTLAMTADLSATGGENEPLVVLADMDFGVVGTTILVSKGGDASLYTTKGGAIRGGGQHEHIRAAAQRLLAEAGKHVKAMTPTTTFPFPTGGNARFYVRTSKQILMAEAPIAKMFDNAHPLSPLFGAAMGVGMPLQELAAKTKSK